MSATPTADLLAHARERGVTLTRRGAQKLLSRLGSDGARERVDSIGALVELASACGHELTALGAARRVDAAGGDFDVAHERLLDTIHARRQRIFRAEWTRREREYYDADARARHAAFLGAIDTGNLGHRATLLLLAAADAGLTRPHAASYRAQLWGLCAVEIGRRHPRRLEVDDLAPVDLVDRVEWEREREHYRLHIAPTVVAEQHARELLERQLRDDDATQNLALTLNRLEDRADFRGDVERILNEIHRRLAHALERADAGAWRPDPNHFRVAVIEPAAEAARAAA